ncbi:MAG: hypothetical protein HQL26_05845 [Candidatus Omnitrophica bacterium]|nr:hypothetical protein [Candidatus Omnitrophota bacterium]
MRKRQQISHEMFSASKRVGSAVKDFAMMRENDRILVELDGTADAWCCLDLLVYRQTFVPVKYAVIAVVPENIFPAAFLSYIQEFCKIHQVTLHIVKELSFVPPAFKCNKIAKSDNFDDIIERIMQMMFLEGKLFNWGDMIPGDMILNSNNQTELSFASPVLIYPLAYIERDLLQSMVQHEYPLWQNMFFPKKPMSSDPSSFNQISAVRDMINQLKKINPGVKKNIFNCVFKINSEYLV